MSRRRGEPTTGILDRGWPHHAVVPADRVAGEAFPLAMQRADELGAANRRAYIRRDDSDFLAFRFKGPEQAEAMAREFGGEIYDANKRGPGTGWAKWRGKV